MAEATGLRNNALPYPVYGAPFGVVFPLLDADGDPISPSSPDSEISKNGDSFGDCTNEAVEIATTSGVCYLLLTATELTTDVAAVRIQSTGAKTTVLTLYPRKLVTVRAGTAAGGAAESITLDAGASAIDDFYNGMMIIGTLDGAVEARICTDYNGTTKVASVTPDWNTTPDSDDSFVVKLPEGVQIPTVNITHAAEVAWASGAITAAVIATGAIDADAIADNAIDAGAIASDAFTAAKFAADCITAAKIANGAIDAATFAADVDAEILSYIVDDATRVDASALNTLSSHDPGETIMGATDLGTGSGLTSLATAAELAKVPKSDSDVTWNATALASIQTEANDALVANNLDHLVLSGVDTSFANTVHVDSVVGQLAQTADAGYDRSTDSLEAVRDYTSPASSALSTTQWTNARAGYLDNLNVGGNVASSAEVTGLNVNTRTVLLVPNQIETPDSSTQVYKVRLHLYDPVGNMEAPDSTPTVTLVNQSGTDRSSRLSAASNPSTGVYTWDYTATAGDAEEQLIWVFTVVEGGATRTYPANSYVVEYTSYRFDSSDRTKLNAIHAKLPSKTYLPGTNNSDGDIEMNEATGNFPGSVASVVGAVGSVTGNVGGNVTGTIGGFTTSAKAEIQTEAEDALVAHRLDELLNADSDIDGAAPPTVGSVFHELMTKTAGSFTYDQTTDSLEALRDNVGTAGGAIQLPSNGLANVTAWTVAITGDVTGNLTGNVGGNVLGTIGSLATQAKADVEAEALDALNSYDPPTNAEMVARTLVAASYATASGVSAVETDTQDIQARLPAALVSGRMDSNVQAAAAALSFNLTGNITGSLSGSVGSVTALSDAAIDSILDEVVESTVTFRQMLRGFASALLGKVSGMDTNAPVFRDVADTKARITAATDAYGNRTTVTKDLT